MLSIVAHAKPAEFVSALASHMHAPSVLLDTVLAFWTRLRVDLDPSFRIIFSSWYSIEPSLEQITVDWQVTLFCASRAEKVTTITLNVNSFINFQLHEWIATFPRAPFVDFWFLNEYLLLEVLIFFKLGWTEILLKATFRQEVVAAAFWAFCGHNFGTFSNLWFAVALEAISADFMPTITYLIDFVWFTGAVAAGAIEVSNWCFN